MLNDKHADFVKFVVTYIKFRNFESSLTFTQDVILCVRTISNQENLTNQTFQCVLLCYQGRGVANSLFDE